MGRHRIASAESLGSPPRARARVAPDREGPAVHEVVDKVVQTYEKDVGPMNAQGRRACVVDPAYKQRLLADGTAAIGRSWASPTRRRRQDGRLRDTAQLAHAWGAHVVVCTLCSCYRWIVSVCRRSGTQRPPIARARSGAAQAWKSSAWSCLRRPRSGSGIGAPRSATWSCRSSRGHEGMSEQELAVLARADAMIGVALCRRRPRRGERAKYVQRPDGRRVTSRARLPAFVCATLALRPCPGRLRAVPRELLPLRVGAAGPAQPRAPDHRGCLGPCALANVALLIFDGRQAWFHSMSSDEQVRALYDWIEELVRARALSPPLTRWLHTVHGLHVEERPDGARWTISTCEAARLSQTMRVPPPAPSSATQHRTGSSPTWTDPRLSRARMANWCSRAVGRARLRHGRRRSTLGASMAWEEFQRQLIAQIAQADRARGPRYYSAGSPPSSACWRQGPRHARGAGRPHRSVRVWRARRGVLAACGFFRQTTARRG